MLSPLRVYKTIKVLKCEAMNSLVMSEENSDMNTNFGSRRVDQPRPIQLVTGLRFLVGVTTKGGKTTTQDVQDNNTNIYTEEPLVINHDKPIESNKVLTGDQPEKTDEHVVQPSSKVQTPPIPFPQRLRKEKEEAQQKKFLENLKQLHINLPFIEALAQIPKYAKFFKGLLTNRARFEEAYTITINERCSAVLLNKLPLEEKDPESFTIPYDIGQLHINNALADLGASISLMPYTMYKKLGLEEPKATRMSLELAIDIPEDSRVPIILGRPFLATARAMIEVFDKNITLRVRDDEVIFDMDQSIKIPPAEDDKCYEVDDLDDTINAEAQKLLANNTSDSFLLKGLEKFIDQSDLESCKSFECKAIDDSDSGEPIWHIESVNTSILPNSDRTQRSRKDNIHLSLWDFRLPQMPFGLCNAPATFQRCVTVIFYDMVEDFMEVFMDDFSVFGKSFDYCLANLDRMLVRCEETNLMLNWEKYHFMVKEGIVLGHKIFRVGIEVDRAKIDVIANLSYPTNVKGGKSFLGHVEFYRRADNLAANHLLRLENPDLGTFTKEEIADKFLDEYLMILKTKLNEDEPWYADYVNYIVVKIVPPNWTPEKRRRQTEVTNRAIKRIMGRSVGYNLKNWSKKLDDALWAFRTAYKIPTGYTPFRLVYGKSCHLPVEIEHKAYWALKQCNMDLIATTKNHFMKLNELMELRDEAYENT
nr:hypothetical protein [Tanacetum cinerariifolium]